MAQKNFKINEVIDVIYQAPGATTGKTVTMEIYDESGAKDLIDFPDVTMAEIVATGRYQGSFTPDAEGEWIIHIALSTGDGKIVKQYSVGQQNINSIGAIVAGIDTQLDTVETKIDGLDSPAMVG